MGLLTGEALWRLGADGKTDADDRDAGWPWQPSASLIGARYLPTPQPAVEAMLALAQVTSVDIVYDPGCGDGRIVITAAQRYGARGVGIDIDEWCIYESRRYAHEANVEQLVTFVHADAMDIDLSPATVVTLYMPAQWNLLFLPKLRRELGTGVRVVTYMYELGSGMPVETRWVMDQYGRSSPIYLWSFTPEEAAGR